MPQGNNKFPKNSSLLSAVFYSKLLNILNNYRNIPISKSLIALKGI